jgi:hypothetical protein
MQPLLMTNDERDNRDMRIFLAFVLRVNSNRVDVGCHLGSFLADCRKYAPQGTHYVSIYESGSLWNFCAHL